MKVLLVRGNPRKTGYTQRLTDWFVQGLHESGAQVTDVHLPELTINACNGCYHCWLAEPGECVHRDGMNALLPELLSADVLVCATPLYYFSMSASLKTFFERLFPLAQPGVSTSKLGYSRNQTRYPDRWTGKKLVTILVGALRDPELFRPANETFRLIADSVEFELGGQLTRPESYLLDYPLSKPKTLRRIEAGFIQAGRETGATGRVSPEAIAAAGAPLASDLHHFRTYSTFYWERACALGSLALAPGEVKKSVANDVRILLREMVRCVDTQAIARVRAVLQFEFPDQSLAFHVALDRGTCTLGEGGVEKPDLLVRCDSGTWAAIFTREINVREALRDGRIVLAGDKSLFMRLDRFFPPPSE